MASERNIRLTQIYDKAFSALNDVGKALQDYVTGLADYSQSLNKTDPAKAKAVYQLARLNRDILEEYSQDHKQITNILSGYDFSGSRIIRAAASVKTLAKDLREMFYTVSDSFDKLISVFKDEILPTLEGVEQQEMFHAINGVSARWESFTNTNMEPLKNLLVQNRVSNQ